jgi:glycosyltransferase involved in cell wall biosynthesis
VTRSEARDDRQALDYSVIVEWENVRLAGSSRAVEMLRRLAMQMRNMRDNGMKGEVALVCDADDPGDESLSPVIHETFGAAADSVRVIVAREKRYYEKKNAGAAAANGGVLVFLDSDVLPEDNWLQRLLSSFSQTDASVVAGATYLEPTTLYTRAVAAFWFFPPRSSDEGLVQAETIFGNNIAFRRRVFLEHPYPVSSQFRGQQGLLVRSLRAKGFQIFLQRGARCAHPAPNGLGHFFRRAVCEGYDNIVISRGAAGPSALPWRHTYWSIRAWLRSSFHNIRERRKPLKLNAIDVLVAALIAICYTAFMVLGEIMTRMDSSLVPRRFSI